MVEIEFLTNRLDAFFVSWRAVGTGRINRLTYFFEQFRLLSAPKASPDLELPAPLSKQLPVRSLEATLQTLRDPLAQARNAGAFLNVWSMAGLKRDEVRNTAVLAALFDPHSHPETGPKFLWAFLQRVMRSSSTFPINEADVRNGYRVTTEEYPLGQAESRVDLSIEGQKFLLMIEVKIDANEGTDQLRRYDDVLRKKAMAIRKQPALIYLSSRPSKNLPCGTVHATWGDVVFAARQVGGSNKKADHSLITALLLQFASHATAFV